MTSTSFFYGLKYDELDKMTCFNTIKTKVSRCVQDYTYIVDLCLALLSFGVYIFDLATDLINAFQYRYRDDTHSTVYFAVSLAFVIFPSLVVQIFSAIFIVNDDQDNGSYQKKHMLLRYTVLLLHFLQMAPLYWYGRVIYFCVQAHRYKNTDHEEFFKSKSKYGLHDGGLLRVIESFLEAAPQLVLQTYIMVTTGVVPWITVMSCVVGVVGITTSMVGFQRALRDQDETLKELPIFPSAVIMALWRIFAVIARVLALTLLANTCWWWFLSLVGIHCVISFIVINVSSRMTQELFPHKIFIQRCFNLICSIIYVFCYFNVHNNNSRFKILHRMIIYYSCTVAENVLCCVLWYYYRTGGWLEEWWGNFDADETMTIDSMTTQSALTTPESIFTVKLSISLVLAVTINIIYAIGLMFMGIYYKFFHPNVMAVKKSTGTTNHLLPNHDESDGERNGSNSSTFISEATESKSTFPVFTRERPSRRCLLMIETQV